MKYPYKTLAIAALTCGLASGAAQTASVQQANNADSTRVSGSSVSNFSSSKHAHLPDHEFSATYQLTHIASQTLLESVRIQVASHGLKVRQLLGPSGASIILNAEVNQLWLADDQRRVYHTLPLAESTDMANAERQMAAKIDENVIQSNDEITGVTSDFMPFVQFEPCLQMDGVLTSEVLIHGKNLQLWACSVDGQLIETQWFDAMLSLVVRGISEDGYSSELLNIQEVDLSVEHFYPPSGYRLVSIEEFMSSVVEINAYKAE